jgi:hypothetical protein
MGQPQPISRPTDPHAARIPIRSGLLPCLYIPIAARDLLAIETYVGGICRQLAPNSPNMAVLVQAHEPARPDARMAIWELPEAAILQAPSQVWVHVDFRAYRRAYIEAFPDFPPAGIVLDHVLNRRVARLKGFQYLRIVPISRSANSSHGALSEDWSVKYHSSPEMRAKNQASQALVQYADLADIVKMLDRKGCGSLMDEVNEAQKLVRLSVEHGRRSSPGN